MNHFNPISGGLNVIITAMRHLKKNDFHVCIYYYSYEEQQSIHLNLQKEFEVLSFDKINSTTDIVVVAEEFIWVAHDLLIPNNIRYIIFNQGIFASLYSYNSFLDHVNTYEQSLAVLVNSLHTSQGVNEIFEVPKEKIYLHRLGIDTNLYYPELKENIACYLNYKNGNFAYYIDVYFRSMYPDWQLVCIDHWSRDDTASLFRKSKLFLSFGGPEGFGLPPLEAAFCGCKVLGFHGEAGKEFFKYPTFVSVNFMDHIDFIEKLHTMMLTIDNKILNEYNVYVDYLKYFYSIQHSEQSIVNFFIHVRDNLFNQKAVK